MRIVSIVEGHGEQEAVPELLRRIVDEVRPGLHLSYAPPQRIEMEEPIRVSASSFLSKTDPSYFEKYLALAAARVREAGGLLLVLLDCEDACPATLGPDLLARAQALHPDIAIVVALAHREYETWFKAAARSLRGVEGLPDDLEPPDDPERNRDSKHFFTAALGVPYVETHHQRAFTQAFSLDEADAVPSFKRLRAKLRAWASALPAPA